MIHGHVWCDVGDVNRLDGGLTETFVDERDRADRLASLGLSRVASIPATVSISDGCHITPLVAHASLVNSSTLSPRPISPR
jgi:hypothetical protein